MVGEYYDLNFVQKCLDKHKPNLDDLRRLEWSQTMDNLPDSREMKCYLHCLLVELRIMKENSTTIEPTEFLGILNQMTTDEQNKYLKLTKKCNKKNKDLCEMVYQMNLCSKRNSNEDYYTFWKPNLEPGY